MHGGIPAAAHLVPIVPRHLEFCGHRHFNLGQREQIVEAGLAGNLLRQEPEHVSAGRAPPARERAGRLDLGPFP